MINVIWGVTHKPISAKDLAEIINADSRISGTLYVGYPIIGTIDGAFAIDALMISPEVGLILFDLVEGRELDDYKSRQDEGFTKLQAKLLQHSSLTKARQLAVPMRVVTFTSLLQSGQYSENADYRVCDRKSLSSFLHEGADWSEELYKSTVAVLQAISTIRKGKRRRDLRNPLSRGSKLKHLEDSIANLDSRQSAAVIETYEGVQRIRGLAGSGKTVVLALKVAYLHAQHPDWKIAVTFHTRSLKAQFERLITTFTIEQTNEEPDWNNIHVIHAWGAPGEQSRNGLYYNFCKLHGTTYLDFKSAQVQFGRGREFEGACELALNQVKALRPAYDAILVDEAQDLSPQFLRLCFAYLHHPQRLVYAYDELQNLTNKTLPPPEDIFGTKPDGTPVVAFRAPSYGQARQDIILEKCYRNARPVLVSAHAVGFGIYRSQGLAQIFDRHTLWQDVGYRLCGGELEDGKEVCLHRTADTSPEFLENHSEISDLIQFHSFTTDQEQTDWITNEILKNVREDELQLDDIIVINPDPLTTREKVASIRHKLNEMGIKSNLAGVSTSPDIFSSEDAITFTGIFRAKGNEAGMVYIINAQDCFTAWRGELATVRNRLFTAITRSKAWVRVVGVGEKMIGLQDEFNLVRDKDFSLQFRYPTEEERSHLSLVHRDMTPEEKKAIEQKSNAFKEIVESLKSGDMVLGDLEDEAIEILRALIDKKGK